VLFLLSEKHRGFGFVEFCDADDAAAALENMQDSELYGRVLKCNLAKAGAAAGGAVWAGQQADEWYGNLPKSADAIDAAVQHQQNVDAKARTKQ